MVKSDNIKLQQGFKKIFFFFEQSWQLRARIAQSGCVGYTYKNVYNAPSNGTHVPCGVKIDPAKPTRHLAG